MHRRRYKYVIKLTPKQLEDVLNKSNKERCWVIFRAEVDLWCQVLTVTTGDGNSYKLPFNAIYLKDEPELDIDFQNGKIVNGGAAITFGPRVYFAMRDLLHLWWENGGA